MCWVKGSYAFTDNGQILDVFYFSLKGLHQQHPVQPCCSNLLLKKMCKSYFCFLNGDRLTFFNVLCQRNKLLCCYVCYCQLLRPGDVKLEAWRGCLAQTHEIQMRSTGEKFFMIPSTRRRHRCIDI